MDRLNRRVVAAFAALLLLGVGLILVGRATDDGGGGARAEPPATVPTTAPPEPEACIDVPEIDGTTAAPVCALGFGIALPVGWDSTRLDGDSLERLSTVDLSRPSFHEAAVRVAATGAVFYAAGVDDEDRVSDLKIDVQDGVDTSADAIRSEAQALVDSGEVEDAALVDEGDGRVRVDYRLSLPDAETGEALEVHGSRLFVPDGDRLWSLIVTSEDAGTLADLVDVFSESITFD